MARADFSVVRASCTVAAYFVQAAVAAAVPASERPAAWTRWMHCSPLRTAWCFLAVAGTAVAATAATSARTKRDLRIRSCLQWK